MWVCDSRGINACLSHNFTIYVRPGIKCPDDPSERISITSARSLSTWNFGGGGNIGGTNVVV